jgi:hypothetical protein
MSTRQFKITCVPVTFDGSNLRPEGLYSREDRIITTTKKAKTKLD